MIKEALESRTAQMSAETRTRAASYMRYKETQSSFEIEEEADKTKYIPFQSQELTLFSETKAWCQLLRRVRTLRLDTKEGTLIAAKKLFPEDAHGFESWRDSEVSTLSHS
jgi:hypothetical protein